MVIIISKCYFIEKKNRLALGLEDIETIVSIQPHLSKDENQSTKIIIFIPKDNVDQFIKELGNIEGIIFYEYLLNIIKGVGKIENYSHCSFRTEGKGN